MNRLDERSGTTSSLIKNLIQSSDMLNMSQDSKISIADESIMRELEEMTQTFSATSSSEHSRAGSMCEADIFSQALQTQ